MVERRADVAAFLAAVQAGFACSDTSADTRRCVDAVFSLLDRPGDAARNGPRRFPACDALSAALEPAKASRPEYAKIATTFEALASQLSWAQRSGGPNASANIMDGHANAMVVGPGGLEQRDDAWVGASLLAPNTRYPDHRHDPEEAYLVLGPGEFRQGDDPWFEPGIGGTFHNVPDIRHAMRSGEAPLFAIWCLRPHRQSP